MALVANMDGSSLAAVAVAVAAASTSSAKEGRPTIRLASGIRPAGSIAFPQFDSQPNSARIGRSALQQAVSPARAGIRPPNQRPETPPVMMRRHNASATAPPGMTQASSPNRPSPSTAASPPSVGSQHPGTGRGRMPTKQRASSLDLVETLDSAYPLERGVAHSSPYVRSSASATRSPVLGAINGKVSVPTPQRSLSRAMAPGPARSQQQFQQPVLQTCQVRPHEATEELSSSQLSRSSPSSYMLQSAPKMAIGKTVSQLHMAQASASSPSTCMQHGLVHRDAEEDFDFQAMTTPRRNFHPSSSSTPLRQKHSSTQFPFPASPAGRSPSPPTSFQQTSGGSIPRRAPQRSQSASLMSSLSQNHRGTTHAGGQPQADHLSPRRKERLQAPGFSSPPAVAKENSELLGNSFNKRNTLPRSFVSAWRRDSARNTDSVVSPRGAAASSAKPSLDSSRQQRPQMLSSPSSAAVSSAPNTSRKSSGGYVNCSGGTSRGSTVATYGTSQMASVLDETAAKVQKPESSSRRVPTQVSNAVQEGVGHESSSSSSANALRLEIGTCSLQGLKSGNPNWVNQDTSLIFKLQPSVTLVAVFDGHGENGRLISDRVKALFEQFAEPLILQGNANVQGGLCQLFALVQSVLDREGMSRLSGTTATIAIIDQAASSMVTAHTGDSKLMLIRAAEVEFETVDHVVDADDERRVIAAGGEVRELDGSANAGVRRIFMRGQNLPGLAMSRSLGDMEAHNIGALAEPEISTTLSIKHGDVVILASDGVWDKLPREFVAANVAVSKAEPSAHAMAFAARAGWPPEGDIDDITAVVVQVLAADDPSEGVEGVSANGNGISSG